MEKNLFLIVGLGNPGRQYRNTRHNIGFQVIDRLAADLQVRLDRMQSRAMVGTADGEDARILLAKPQTFMNLSGQSVSGLVRFFKIELERVLVIHDDIDLPLGTIRLRPGGGSAGQKGVTSTIDRLGTEQFARLRLGVGRPSGTQEAAGYVLQEWSSADTKVLDLVLPEASQAAQAFVRLGLAAAMNQFNGQVRRE